MRKLRVLSVFGTRPEAIKMAPLVHRLNQTENIEHRVCSTGQHRQLLAGVLEFFAIEPFYELNIMRPRQDLTDITFCVLAGLKKVFREFRPDWVLVHGDTSTCFAAALGAFHAGIRIGHVEAGLRTHCLASPFPEEANRVMTDRLSNAHFAPTQRNALNLINEGISPASVTVTGNTVIDALKWAKNAVRRFSGSISPVITRIFGEGKWVLLVTCHRRENMNEGLSNLCTALAHTAWRHPDLHIVFPVHLNPDVRAVTSRKLSGFRNIHLIQPPDYPDFVLMMVGCRAILTDSGGIQEEATALSKPLLVMRSSTERPELLDSGAMMLVGTDPHVIERELSRLYEGKGIGWLKDTGGHTYGEGNASQKITDILLSSL